MLKTLPFAPKSQPPSSDNPLSIVFPWESYEERHGIFVSQNSLGFTIEAIPLVSSLHVIQKELSSLIEEEESIQCLLWADQRINSFLERWDNSRKRSDASYRLISRRKLYFFQMPKQYPFRSFRFILSYSVQGKNDPLKLERLKRKKEKILNRLKKLTYSYCWDGEDLCENFCTLIRNVAVKEIPSQLSIGSLDVDGKYLRWTTDTSTYLKTFRVIEYPQSDSLARMQRLMENIFRIEAPFYLQYAIHFPKSSDNTSIWFQFSAGIWADKENLETGAQSLKNLFCLNQFNLTENHYLHLPSLLSVLPMNWGEYVQDLKKLKLLYATLSSEYRVFLPLWLAKESPLFEQRAEWKHGGETMICDIEGNYSNLNSIFTQKISR